MKILYRVLWCLLLAIIVSMCGSSAYLFFFIASKTMPFWGYFFGGLMLGLWWTLTYAMIEIWE